MNRATEIRERTVGQFLDAIASADPTPGGGSVAAVAGAMAAALGMMVVAVSTKRGSDETLTRLGERFHAHRESLVAMAAQDELAFEEVMAAYRISKDDASRPSRIEQSLHAAADVPLQTLERCVALLNDLECLAPRAGKNITSDVRVAAALARCVVSSACYNVEVNCRAIKDDAQRNHYSTAQEDLAQTAYAIAQRIEDVLSA